MGLISKKVIAVLVVIFVNILQVTGNVVLMRIKGDNLTAAFVSQTVDVQINFQESVGFTGPKYIGVAIDASFFRSKWKQFDVYSRTLHSLAQGLAPSFVRVGGSAADFLIFNATAPGAPVCEQCESDYDAFGKPVDKNFTMSGRDWERLNYLVQVAQWDLIFDVNEFQRNGSAWNPENARQLLKYSQDRGYKIPYFQLGNEPNAYYHNFHFRITPQQLLADMRILKSLLAEFPQYRSSLIIGPEVTKVVKRSAHDYLEGFLQAGGQSTVTAATLHHYYFNAQVSHAHLHDFVNTTILNSLNQELQIATSVVQQFAPSLPVWFSETSSVSGGGLEGGSDAYVAGFMWLDKLGLSALYGLQTVIRQTFYHGRYALVADDLTPLPDYFLTVLYKRLVQGHVFRVPTSTDTVRIYAHCANPDRYSAGALTVYVLNVQSEPVTLNLTQFSGQKLDLYLLTPGDQDGLKSKYVALNGVQLAMTADEQLPPMPPEIHSGPVSLPPYSFGFIVVPEADVKLCKS